MEHNNPLLNNVERKFPWAKLLGLLLIGIGGVMYLSGFMMGARGVSVSFHGGLNMRGISSTDAAKIQILNTAFDHVHVRTTSFRVVVRPADDFGVYVSGTAEQPTISVSQDGRLDIDTRSTEHSRSVNFGHSYPNIIHIYAPANHALTLDLYGTSGSISVEGVSLHTGNIQSTSGGINLRNSSAAYLSVISTSGSIRISGLSWHELHARSASGSINISGNPQGEQSNTALQSTSGSISANIAGNENEFAIWLDSRSGSIRLGGARVRGRSHVVAEQNHSMSLQSTSGSLRLDFVR